MEFSFSSPNGLNLKLGFNFNGGSQPSPISISFNQLANWGQAQGQIHRQNTVNKEMSNPSLNEECQRNTSSMESARMSHARDFVFVLLFYSFATSVVLLDHLCI
ncbi:uncharacterized protein LOC114275018 [Camellia sinensis]|uniref:uncharacterized protein LOC114275018 n=1 Tax=Camellia sinensis TaxID=4442 RepID=UPI001035A890|nr:uncharacterized protein LOC114275018 [Camellia sinensis]